MAGRGQPLGRAEGPAMIHCTLSDGRTVLLDELEMVEAAPWTPIDDAGDQYKFFGRAEELASQEPSKRRYVRLKRGCACRRCEWHVQRIRSITN
jgi:hypothetical protein